MIPVAPVPEPTDFDKKVRIPGNAWLIANPVNTTIPAQATVKSAGSSATKTPRKKAPKLPQKRPPALWSLFRADLEDGFGQRCGYAAMLDPTGGTVDHYLSCENYRHLAYEWRNYRLVSSTLNSSKRTADDTVLDPYEVQDGWFEILLPSLQMRATHAVPPSLRAKAEYTLTRLKLRDGERVIRWRQSWYQMYLAGELTLAGLARVAPLIARAVQQTGG